MRLYPYLVTVANKTHRVMALTAQDAGRIAMERWGTFPDHVEALAD